MGAALNLSEYRYEWAWSMSVDTSSATLVLLTIARRPGQTVDEMATTTGLHRNTILRVTQELRANETIRKLDRGYDLALSSVPAPSTAPVDGQSHRETAAPPAQSSSETEPRRAHLSLVEPTRRPDSLLTVDRASQEGGSPVVSSPPQGVAGEIAQRVWDSMKPKPDVSGGVRGLTALIQRKIVKGWTAAEVERAVREIPMFTPNSLEMELRKGQRGDPGPARPIARPECEACQGTGWVYSPDGSTQGVIRCLH